MFEQFSKLVKERQACREFNGKPVDKEKLDKIMELSRLAPSACNSQPWKMYCITDENAVKLARDAMQKNAHNKFLDNVNTFIAVVDKQAVLRSDVASRFDRNFFVKYDVGELVAYITLSAKALGLDTCVIGWLEQDKIAEILKLPENEICNLVIAVGYSDISVREKVRKPKDEIIKYV